MQRIVKERDRLLRKTARLVGLSSTATAVLCLLVPAGIAPATLGLCIPLAVTMALCQYFLGRHSSLGWVIGIVFSGVGLILAIGFGEGGVDGLNVVEESVVGIVAAGAVSCVAIVLAQGLTRAVLLAVAAAITLGSVTAVTIAAGGSALPLALAICGWLATGLSGWWMGQSIPKVMQRIAAIGRAHRVERQASELEAQRRHDARLLHDTVLATLTLLAHSGVGVRPEALREQAGDDAQLLRQLRLGGMPAPQRSGVYTLEPATESTLGTTLESVKQRFGRLGLDVDWHGSGQVLLPSDVLDSFLLALAECLENVRRHSGVTRADVTITDDETTVRAMVTDAGIGFDLTAVDTARLGFAESVVARLRDVGGNARLFSSPNSGTTVVLEVPK
jgi:signal transduction histidine kinase